MNKERVEKYISIWLKHIKQQDLRELEEEIEMPLAKFITEFLANQYNKYIDEVPYVPVEADDYSDYIIAPRDGVYSLEDFFLNRLLRNVLCIEYGSQGSLGKFFGFRCYYSHDDNRVWLDKDRFNRSLGTVEQKRKVVAHEILHGMKTQYFDGNFLYADIYYQIKEELKSLFGIEINDFKCKKSEQNFHYKHQGLMFRSSDDDLMNLEEICNEGDSIIFTDDEHVDGVRLGENCTMLIRNPESSNYIITNYSYILDRLIDAKTFFGGLYIDPEIFYKKFNQLYTQTFRKHFNCNLPALDILIKQLAKIKEAGINGIDEHVKLLNALYECLCKKQEFSNSNEQSRLKDMITLFMWGIFERNAEGDLVPFSGLDYCAEFSKIAKNKR